MSPEISDQDTSIVTATTPLHNYPVGSLFITHGEMAGVEIPLSRETFFIGRSKNNNLALNDASVSRKHAVINLLDGEYIISDLNSLKGIYVNGRKVEETTLKPGDMINIGENRMQFRLMSPSGTWRVGKKRRKLVYISIIILLSILIGGGVWVARNWQEKNRLPDETVNKIRMHYIKGIELYNKEHKINEAREEWEKIQELDPEKKNSLTIKAGKLLKSTENETSGK